MTLFITVVRTSVLASLLILVGAVALAQEDVVRVTGRVTDGSGGTLPGVTVSFRSPRLEHPVVVVTDATGTYTAPPLPRGRYLVTFALAGFETRAADELDLSAADQYVLDRRLALAAVEETVEVVAASPPAAAPVARFEAPLRPQTQPVPSAVLASVCGPGQPGAPEAAVGRILAHRDEKTRTLFGDGDVLLLDAGADAGMTPGRNYAVRRRFRIGDPSLPLKYATFGEQTAGLIQVVETSPESSVAVVVYTCGELYAGDTIEPFDPLPMWSAGPDAGPQFDDPARVVFGEHGRQMGGPRQLMVIDRGTAQGVARGQHLTIFRRTHGARGPVSTIGHAIVIAVREDSATMRIERASDAVLIGDLVALHR